MKLVEAYRATWTTETAQGRKQRFDTESRRAANASVNDDFKVRSLRIVPATPQGFEKVVEGLSEKYGMLGLSALRRELGRGCDISAAALRVALMNCGVSLSRVHFNQLMAFLTRGDTFPAEKLYNTLTPPCEDFDTAFVRQQFDSHFGGARAEGGAAVQEVAALYPELEMALLQFLEAYEVDNAISADEFMKLHMDMYVSLPLKYKHVVEKRP